MEREIVKKLSHARFEKAEECLASARALTNMLIIGELQIVCIMQSFTQWVQHSLIMVSTCGTTEGLSESFGDYT